MKYNIKFSPIVTDNVNEVPVVNGQLIIEVTSNSIYLDIEEKRLHIIDSNKFQFDFKVFKMDTYTKEEVNNRLNAINAELNRIVETIGKNLADLHAEIVDVDNALTAHKNDKSNPHDVTKDQVGLGKVDNTSDLDKPISTATQTALDAILRIVNKEIDDRQNADSGLSGDIATVAGDLETAKTNLSRDIGSEASARQSADTALGGRIDTVDGRVTGEATARENADTALSGRITDIEVVVPSSASANDKLTTESWVNSTVATNTANFRGTFDSKSELLNYSGPITNNDYAFVINGLITDNGNDWSDFASLDAYNKALLTNLDYAFVVNAIDNTKFDFYKFAELTQEWILVASEIDKDEAAISLAYNRYKAVVTESGNVTISEWRYEYTLNNSSFTADQWKAINSGITEELVLQITTNKNAITALQDSKQDKLTFVTVSDVDDLFDTGEVINNSLALGGSDEINGNTVEINSTAVIENHTLVL